MSSWKILRCLRDIETSNYRVRWLSWSNLRAISYFEVTWCFFFREIYIIKSNLLKSEIYSSTYIWTIEILNQIKHSEGLCLSAVQKNRFEKQKQGSCSPYCPITYSLSLSLAFSSIFYWKNKKNTVFRKLTYRNKDFLSSLTLLVFLEL